MLEVALPVISDSATATAAGGDSRSAWDTKPAQPTVSGSTLNGFDLREAVRDHYSQVRRRFGALVCDPSLADDLTQEVFVRLCEAMSAGRPVRDLSRFICGISVNVFRQALRQRARWASAPILLHSSSNLQSASAPQSQVLEDREHQDILMALVGKLTPEDQAILVAVYFMDMSTTQLGETLNVPRQTALSRLYRAIERLRQLALAEGLTW